MPLKYKRRETGPRVILALNKITNVKREVRQVLRSLKKDDPESLTKIWIRVGKTTGVNWQSVKHHAEKMGGEVKAAIAVRKETAFKRIKTPSQYKVKRALEGVPPEKQRYIELALRHTGVNPFGIAKVHGVEENRVHNLQMALGIKRTNITNSQIHGKLRLHLIRALERELGKPVAKDNRSRSKIFREIAIELKKKGYGVSDEKIRQIATGSNNKAIKEGLAARKSERGGYRRTPVNLPPRLEKYRGSVGTQGLRLMLFRSMIEKTAPNSEMRKNIGFTNSMFDAVGREYSKLLSVVRETAKDKGINVLSDRGRFTELFNKIVADYYPLGGGGKSQHNE